MRKIVFLLCLFSSAELWAGKLDIDYIKPSPTTAAAASFIFPGAGWFYLNSATKDPILEDEYMRNGIFHLIATGAAVALVINRANAGDKDVALACVGLTVGIRFADIFKSIDAAEKERYINSRLLLNYTEKP